MQVVGSRRRKGQEGTEGYDFWQTLSEESKTKDYPLPWLSKGLSTVDDRAGTGQSPIKVYA